MKISFIGAGNVAWHLSQALENAGNSVQEVFSRDPKKAKELGSFLYNARVQEHLDFSESSAEVFFMCIPESAYPQVLPELLLPKYGILVLVSGTAQLAESMLLYDPLRESMNQIGVFFPVQHVLTGRKLNLSNTPICVEVLVEETETILLALAKDVSDSIYLVNGEERKKNPFGDVDGGYFYAATMEPGESIVDLNRIRTSISPRSCRKLHEVFFLQSSDISCSRSCKITR